MNTVTEIFHALDRAAIEWAVIPEIAVGRNTRLDLVIRRADIPRFRGLLLELANRGRWDALTECSSHGGSTAEHDRFEVFRFYRLQPLEVLRVAVWNPLSRKNVSGFRTWMRRARVLFARRRDQRLRLATEPRGLVLRVRASGQHARDAVYSALDTLAEADAIDEWGVLPANAARLGGRERHVPEPLLLTFTSDSDCDVAVEENAEARDVTATLLLFLIRRHAVRHDSAELPLGKIACVF